MRLPAWRGTARVLVFTLVAATSQHAVYGVTGTIVGVGVSLEPATEGAAIEAVIPGSPAQRAGLTAGDLIVEIDDVPVHGMPLTAILAKLGGAPDAPVRLTVKTGQGAPRQIAVTRQRFTRSGRPPFDGGYPWLGNVIKRVGPYVQIKEICARAGKSDLDAFDPGCLVQWLQTEFHNSRPTDMAARRDILFLGLDIAAAMSADERFEPLREYWIETAGATAEQLTVPPRPGFLTIHKLYNEGVILRTPGACLGIDIFLHPRTPPAVIEAISGHLDGLLVTHTHGDHVTPSLGQSLAQQGKPVVFATESPFISIGDRLQAGEIGKASWSSFSGRHIGPTFSGFYVVTLGDWRVIHSGDNTVWTPAFLGSPYAEHVDVFFVKLEASAPRAVSRIRPRYFVPQHLLELNHGLDAYGHDTLALRHRNSDPTQPHLLMLQWGDSYEIPGSHK